MKYHITRYIIEAKDIMKIDVSSIRAILISAEGLQCHEDVTDCDA
jgi:hypothetical protein